MPIRFECEHCGKRLKADENHVGARVRCPRCGNPVHVPSPEPEPTDVVEEVAVAADDDIWQGPPLENRPRRNWGDDDDELDMTPMVDVTFLLLIFFMMTAAFSLEKSIEMPTPDQQEEVAQQRTLEDFEEEDYIIVRIDGDDTVWVEDAEAPSEQDLLSRLRELRGSAGDNGGRPANSLLVVASGDARHETVVRVLDAGHAVSMENVSLATVEDDEF